jgi:flagellar hook-associated protein 1 FlgK
MLNTLNVAQSGLFSSKTSVENVMNNIANENTVGYKKRVVDVNEAGMVDDRITGRGTEVASTYRITDRFMYDKLMGEKGTQEYYTQLGSTLEEVEAVFFEVNEDSGLSYDLDKYFQAIEDLRSNPQNEVYEKNLITNADLLVKDIKNVYNDLNVIQSTVKDSAYQDVDMINNILNQIGSVNEKIYGEFQSTNDLFDKRDALEEQLADYFDIDVTEAPRYNLKIAGRDAISLNTNVNKVTVNESYVAQVDVYGSSLNDTTITNGQKLKFQFNNTKEFEITMDTSYTGNPAGTYADDNYSVKRQIMDSINSDPVLKNSIKAELNMWNELTITSINAGTSGKFTGTIAIETPNANVAQTDYTTGYIAKESKGSIEAKDAFTIQVLGQDLNMDRGLLKAKTENLDSSNSDNKIEVYKQKLDTFVKALVDMSDKYIRQNNGNYISGEKSSDNYVLKQGEEVTSIGLFSGTDVNSLVFNSTSVNNFDQNKLNYLATLQWNNEIDFDGTGKNMMGFSSYYQTIQTKVSGDHESNKSLENTQKAVTASLQESYDKITKVDKDEEMMNLIKFQAAYEANAKIVTTVDAMIKIILGLKQA